MQSIPLMYGEKNFLVYSLFHAMNPYLVITFSKYVFQRNNDWLTSVAYGLYLLIFC